MAATSFISPIALILQAFSDQGVVGSGYLINTYLAGSTTPIATYTDSTLTVANANPIVLRSNGRLPASVWGAPGTVVKMVITDPVGNVLPGGTVDNLPLINDVGTSFYPQTAVEKSTGIVPASYSYPELDPRRYGAVGDGVTTDTNAISQLIIVANAESNPVSTWPVGQVYAVGVLTNLTATNMTLNAFGTLKSLPNAMTGTTSLWTISGANTRIYGLTVDGNQANYSTQAGNALIYFNGVSNLLLDGVTLKNSSLKGAEFFQINGGQFSNCHFDSNANLGWESNAASYMKFVNCTCNYNGYGFQKTLATNQFAAFGGVYRFRSHHNTQVGCEYKQNGRDGMCTNQGSYANKFLGCLAWMNGDGGFTIASDNTGSGLPGEAEACYDLEYIDCEAYNNWSSGLSAYNGCFNVTVEGGRYYNNNRLAGTQTLASAYFSGVYITQSSQGIRIRTKAYDDRQLCPITVSSGNTVNATGWVNGTMGNYPRVAFYNANMVFQGYGTITAEASPNVSYSTTAYNGVTVANVVPGWFITQRVQHNGVFFDNGAQGEIDVDGFGFLPGPAGYSGFKSVVGYLGNGQNVLLPGTGLDYTELLANPTWDAGVTNWTFNPSGGTGAGNYYTTAGTGLRSPGSLQLVGGSQGIVGDGTLVTSALAYAQGCYVEASVWVNAQAPLDASIFLFWNPGTGSLYSSVTHPGGGWKQLKIGIFVPAGNTSLTFRMQSSIGKTNYFDNASLRVKFDKTDQRDYTYPSRNLPV